MHKNNALIITAICGILVFSVPCMVQSQVLSWDQINESGFGYSNTRASGMTVFNGSLYVGTINQVEKAQVWCYDGDTWTQVNNNGFGNSSNNMVTSMAVLNGKLCAGTHNTATYCEVWQHDFSTSVISITSSNYKLEQNYPNPFNSTTTINYQLPKSMTVNISIYDIRGHLVETLIDERKDTGSHSVAWDAENIKPGVYYYKIMIGEYSETKKCLLLK